MSTTLRDIGFRLGFDVDKQSEKKAEDSIKALKSTATKLLGAIGIGFSFAKFRQITEEFNGINDKINYAVKGLADQKEAQQAILKAANDTKTSYAGMADSVAQLVQVNKELFPLNDAVQFATLTQKLMISAGKSESQASALQGTIAKVFQTGQVSSGVLRNLYNQAPEVINTIAEGMGVTSDKLYDLAEQGVLTGATLKKAILGASKEIEASFDGLDYSISDAVMNIRNTWGYFLDSLNSTLGITSTIAKAMVKLSNTVMGYAEKIKTRIEWLAEKLGGTDKLLRLIAITAGGIFAALNAGKILSFLKTVGQLLNAGSMKMKAMIAIFIIIALLIDDLINFMKGNDSLIGEFFKKSGGDAEAFRQTIRGLLDRVKEIIPVIMQFAKTIGQRLMEAIMKILPFFIDFVENTLPVLIDLIMTIIEFILELAEGGLSFILDAVSELLPFLMKLIGTVLPPLLALIKRIMPIIKELAASVGRRLLAMLEAILPRIMEFVQKALPPLIKLVETVIDVLLQLLDSCLDVILSLIEQLLPLLLDIIEKVLPIVVDLIVALLPLLMEIIDAVLPVIIELIETLLPIIMEIIDAILPIIIELIETLLPLIIQIVEELLPVIIELIEALLPIITQIIEAILPVILELLTAILPILEPIIQLIADVVGTLLPPLVTLLEAILPLLEPILAILKPIADILGVVIGAIAKVVGWVTSGLGWIVRLIFGDGGGAENAEKINAYAKGTESSSDTFIAGEEGPELVTGQKGKKVFTALETGKIFQAMAMLGKAATVQPSTVTNTNSTRTITQYNEFVNTFNGDRAGQQKSAAAMSSASDDALAYMARALQFARG